MRYSANTSSPTYDAFALASNSLFIGTGSAASTGSGSGSAASAGSAASTGSTASAGAGAGTGAGASSGGNFFLFQQTL